MKEDIVSKKGEIQYQQAIRDIKENGFERFGLMSSWAWRDDPRRLAFTFSRYKFVSKMLAGRKDVVEIGCGDAFASRIVRQTVENLTAIDFDPSFIEDAKNNRSKEWPIIIKQHDMLEGALEGQYDAGYSLDVLEHIPKSLEDQFLQNFIASIIPEGVVIIGMPSLQSQSYASYKSKIGHVNCKDQTDFKKLMQKYFQNVFMFSMNDEVVHTGYEGMSHYNIALCCNKINLKGTSKQFIGNI